MIRPLRRRVMALTPAAVLLATIVPATIVLTAPASAAPSHAPSATASPASGLRDGQVVTVRGSGFPPRTNIQILECRATVTAPPSDERACEGLTDDASAYTDPRGAFVDEAGDPSGRTSGFTVAVLPTPRFKTTSIECGPTAPCVLYVGTQPSDFSQPHAFVGLAFAGQHRSGGAGWWPWLLAAVIAAVALVAFALRRRDRRARRGGRRVSAR